VRFLTLVAVVVIVVYELLPVALLEKLVESLTAHVKLWFVALLGMVVAEMVTLWSSGTDVGPTGLKVIPLTGIPTEPEPYALVGPEPEAFVARTQT
jgi:hypothetical protein